MIFLPGSPRRALSPARATDLSDLLFSLVPPCSFPRPSGPPLLIPSSPPLPLHRCCGCRWNAARRLLDVRGPRGLAPGSPSPLLPPMIPKTAAMMPGPAGRHRRRNRNAGCSLRRRRPPRPSRASAGNGDSWAPHEGPFFAGRRRQPGKRGPTTHWAPKKSLSRALSSRAHRPPGALPMSARF